MFDEVAQKLSADGAVGVLPSDTVYGLVARASDATAVKRLYDLKLREGKPGTIIAANIEQLEQLGLKRRYLKAVEQYWPGPVSVIIPCGPELEYLHEGKNSLAVRIPDNKQLCELLEQTGSLLTSSANHPGEPTANTVEEAQAYFGDKVDFYVDGGDLSGHKPSTVVRIVDDAIVVLRQGAVTINEETGEVKK
ncbi:MAG TPA: L-threonylcarbamoyladenylate synthase [Candidatus Saccharimonadales bacterium]|nr:L-threonylcarbamoyladenylate synthase [Candidatus Saccharimonadales bacterium]